MKSSTVITIANKIPQNIINYTEKLELQIILFYTFIHYKTIYQPLQLISAKW